MNNALKKYLSEASSFMSDETISEGTKIDKDAAAVVIVTESKKEPTPASVATKQAKINKLRKSTIKEEDADADKLEEEDEIEGGESCNEDEDDGAEDGEICEGEEGEEEGDEMADDDQIEDPKKKKMDIKESYIANASRWM